MKKNNLLVQKCEKIFTENNYLLSASIKIYKLLKHAKPCYDFKEKFFYAFFFS